MATFGEIKRQVTLRLNQSDGRTNLIVEQAINDTLRFIATARDFDELMTLDTTHAFTVASQKSYHIINNLALVRPKDIYSIRYMDEGDSIKLTYVSLRDLDEYVPYTEQSGTGRPSYYTVRGMYIELYRIPDEAKPLYIQHSQWPAALVVDTDETPFINIDPVIVSLSTDIATSILQGNSSTDWTRRAIQLLSGAVKEDNERPDRFFIAKPFSPTGHRSIGEYWKDPFYRGK